MSPRKRFQNVIEFRVCFPSHPVQCLNVSGGVCSDWSRLSREEIPLHERQGGTRLLSLRSFQPLPSEIFALGFRKSERKLVRGGIEVEVNWPCLICCLIFH